MKRLTRILIIVAVLDLLGVGVLWFEYSTINAKRSEEAQLREEIAGEKQKGVEFITAQKIVTQATKESGALDKYFYGQEEESQIYFIAQIEALGTSTGAVVEVRSLESTGGGTPIFHGELGIKGTWRESFHLLRLLETFPAYLVVNHFSVSAPNKKDIGAGLWTGVAGIDLMSVKSP